MLDAKSMWDPSGWKRDQKTQSLCIRVSREENAVKCWLFSYCLSAPNLLFNTHLSNAKNSSLETIFLFCQLAFSYCQ